MKFSNYYSYCGIIHHPITQIIENLKIKDPKECVVVCLTDEIFDEAMTTIMNRFPQAVGLVTIPNPGVIMGKRVADVVIPIKLLDAKLNDMVLKLKVVTEAEYTADKTAIDLLKLPIFHISWSGGQK